MVSSQVPLDDDFLSIVCSDGNEAIAIAKKITIAITMELVRLQWQRYCDASLW